MPTLGRTHHAAALVSEAGFDYFSAGRWEGWLRSDLAPKRVELLKKLCESPMDSALDWGGNRGSGALLELSGAPPVFVRRGRRGGLMRFVVRDLYFGLTPRPLLELAVTVRARAKNLPVVRPLGALVERATVATYRGYFLSEPLRGQTLWDYLTAHERNPEARSRALKAAREAIAAVIQGGLKHPDLNLHNLMVVEDDGDCRVVVLDLDRARLGARELSQREQRQIRARLLRSAKKLDPSDRMSIGKGVCPFSGCPVTSADGH